MSTLKDKIYNLVANIHNRHVAGCTSKNTADIKIFVFRHFRCNLPSVFDDRRIYHPIWCGLACQHAKQNELCDNTGENISKYNPYLNEITGVFWVATHYKELGNPAFVGFNHYRRHLEWSPSLIGKGSIIATSETIIQWIGYWLRLTLPVQIRQPTLDKLSKELESAGFHDFKRYLLSHRIYARNMFITDRDTFFRYFTFIRRYISLFMSEIDKDEAAFSSAPPVQKRFYGYMLEQLTSYWIWHERRTKSSKVITTCVDDFDVKPVK